MPKLASQDLSPEEAPGSIHGTVVNGVTHEPIGHALVFSPDNRFATMTDDPGHFEFVLPRPEPSRPKSQPTEAIQPSQAVNDEVAALKEASIGSRSLRPLQLGARKPGFLDDNVQQNIAPDQKEVTIQLIPESLVIGRVVLPDDTDRILVEIDHRQVQDGRAHWVTAQTTVAKSNGEFRLAGLHPGAYKLFTQELLDRDPLTFDPHAQLYGYPPVYFPTATELASAATIELTAGSTFQANLSPVRQPYYQVRVPVANAPSGAGLQVAVSSQGRRGPDLSLGYNQQAQRIEGMLPAGTYTLEALSSGSPALTGTVTISLKGGVLQAPAMILQPSGSIAVVVKEEFTSTDNTGASNGNGHPIRVSGPRRYLNMMLWSADDFGLENAAYLGPPSAPGDEALAVPNVQPGRYWVQVTSYRGYPASITSGGTDLLDHPLVVGAGGSASPIEITMRDDWAHCVAKIERTNDVRPGGSSNAGSQSPSETNVTPAWLYLVPLPDSPGQFQEIPLSLNNESAEIQVSPGEYRVLAFDHQHPKLEYRNPEAMRAYDEKGPVVHFLAGQKEQMTLISNNEEVRE
jgi:hypothetical protein